MFTLFIVLHVIFCIFLILVILLQTGKGAGIGAAFGGGSQTVFGPRGAGSFIGKVTGAVAGLFMLTSMILAFLSTSRSDNVAKAVEALKAERATTVESVSLTEPKDTAAPNAEAPTSAAVATGTDADINPAGTDAKADTISTDEKTGEGAPANEIAKGSDAAQAAPSNASPAETGSGKPAKAPKPAKAADTKAAAGDQAPSDAPKAPAADPAPAEENAAE